ncbi:hypothetical protein [Metabacillus iocasae]|uniref:Membrane protein YgcG n=1 Tax=Priestia iocasae TaxID=2291674 RepID=A0ABS2QUG3_9BACI|nr:hypothetical protein [Metabacillus iocasae]MBM7702843.1 putative membrane protein YgcG [Metabacillus iocasae]
MEMFVLFIIIAFIFIVGMVAVKGSVSPSKKRGIRTQNHSTDSSAGSIGFFSGDSGSDCGNGGSGGGDSGGGCGGGGGD